MLCPSRHEAGLRKPETSMAVCSLIHFLTDSELSSLIMVCGIVVVFKVRGVVGGVVGGGECGGGEFCVFKFVFVGTLLPPPPVFSLLDCLLPCCVPPVSEPSDESGDESGGPVFETRVRCVPAFLLIPGIFDLMSSIS